MKRKYNIFNLLSMMLVIITVSGIILHNNFNVNTTTESTEVENLQNDETQLTEILQMEEIEVPTVMMEDVYVVKSRELQEKMDELDNIESNLKKFLQYKNIIEEYSEWFDKPETIYDCFTEEEIMYMLRCIETETYQCSFDSKVNVASVILNRIESGNFGENAIEVITAKNQFAYFRTDISDDTKFALEYAFEYENTARGALFFHSNNWTETFSGGEYVFSDDAVHHFYK